MKTVTLVVVLAALASVCSSDKGRSKGRKKSEEYDTPHIVFMPPHRPPMPPRYVPVPVPVPQPIQPTATTVQEKVYIPIVKTVAVPVIVREKVHYIHSYKSDPLYQQPQYYKAEPQYQSQYYEDDSQDEFLPYLTPSVSNSIRYDDGSTMYRRTLKRQARRPPRRNRFEERFIRAFRSTNPN